MFGPLLFNIDVIDLFLNVSYADGSTPYSCAQDISSVISELQRFAIKIFDWYRNNYMKANPGKCHAI